VYLIDELSHRQECVELRFLPLLEHLLLSECHHFLL
jgi:hypothetical protein